VIGLLGYLGIIQCQGKDSKTFLQGQLTCDLNKLSPGQQSLGAHCNIQGRIVSLFRIIQSTDDTYFLVLPKTMISIALTALKKYAIFSKLTLTDISDTVFVIGHCEPPHRHMEFSEEASSLQDISTEWRFRDILAGIPNIYPETSGKFIPQRLNLVELGAVSFKKGCYIGQEVLSRLYFKGSVKYKLFLGRMMRSEALTPGENIYNNSMTKVGHIVDSVFFQEITYLLLEKGSEEALPLYARCGAKNDSAPIDCEIDLSLCCDSRTTCHSYGDTIFGIRSILI
jgi:folate-binding protein YgfZ